MAVGLALAAVGGRGSVVGTPDVMATGVEGGRGWRVVMGVAETGNKWRDAQVNSPPLSLSLTETL